MSQWDVLNVLEHDKDRYFSRQEIANLMKKNPSEISSCMRRLRMSGLIDVNLKGHINIYKFRENWRVLA
jgi:Mn-dependent DtxR family transcriptional regulator